ncbi:MAG: MFS transporter [Alphaproteobacteria bacterium]|nr:MFS transporter [Alphaproteobacteria bacterium]MBU1515104.1 MFS transporter [Alphaproteobacteria bacterium]MBU2093462.1 MFS transporter [Alphaproteobacteria bacterium]MBU2152310.1 MFS transporter [Alphaproteobacteria bacterium]MBU2308124.1 MFS transporter [Alphaproteobacteria bacterium]
MAVVEGLGGVPAETQAAQGVGALKPPGGVKFFYSVGQFVESGYLAINTFIFFYYTAVLGLSGSMVGVALAISMTVDAALDPLIGSWSDSVRSRFGRRLPVMLVAAPLTMVTMGLLFAPPSGLTPLLLFVWLTLTKGGVRAFASMYNIPYFALGGEMSDDYVERSRIVSYRLLSGILVSVLITAMAYSLFFAGEGGLQRAESYPAFGWAIAALVLVGGLICCAGVWRYAVALPQPTAAPAPLMRRFVGEVAEMLRNRTFVILFLSMLLFASGVGVHQALSSHAYVFVWKVRPETIQLITYVYLAGILVGVPLTPALLRHMEKKTVAALGFGLVAAGWIVLPGLRGLGLFAPIGAAALPWLSLTALVFGLASGLVFIVFPSMMADAAEEHEQLHGARREGLFFSGLGFAGKASNGMGLMIGGFALDLLRFPREMGRQVNAVVPEDVLAHLTLAWGWVPAVLVGLGALVFAPYAITRARHEQITAELRLRRAAAAD